MTQHSTTTTEPLPLPSFKSILAAKLEFLLRLEGPVTGLRARFNINRSSFYRWRRGQNVPWTTLLKIDEMYKLALEQEQAKKRSAELKAVLRKANQEQAAKEHQAQLDREWDEEMKQHELENPDRTI